MHFFLFYETKGLAVLIEENVLDAAACYRTALMLVRMWQAIIVQGTITWSAPMLINNVVGYYYARKH